MERLRCGDVRQGAIRPLLLPGRIADRRLSTGLTTDGRTTDGRTTKAARPGGRARILLAIGLLGAALAACNAGGGEALSPAGTTAATLTVTSQSFASDGEIPVDYTCDGTDKSPQLTWSAPPPGTRSFAIVVEDPDSASGTFTHWIIYNIGADARSLPEAVDPATVNGASGLNDFKRPGYGGPCPPKLELHHYTFRIFALNTTLGEGLELSRDAFDTAINGHVLAVGALGGSFSH